MNEIFEEICDRVKLNKERMARLLPQGQFDDQGILRFTTNIKEVDKVVFAIFKFNTIERVEKFREIFPNKRIKAETVVDILMNVDTGFENKVYTITRLTAMLD